MFALFPELDPSVLGVSKYCYVTARRATSYAATLLYSKQWTVKLSWLENAIHANLFEGMALTSKVGYIYRPGFWCARLQVSVYSGYDLCHPG